LGHEGVGGFDEIKRKKKPQLAGASKIFFVRVSLLDSLSGLDQGFSDVDFVYRFFVDWMVGFFEGFG